jgi:small subunit ribosomal protein S16
MIESLYTIMLKLKLYPTGKKNQIKYRVVVAEARSKREGKYIESLGFYDPQSEPATIKIDKVKFNQWIKKGAQPTPTVRLLAKKA